MSQKVVDEPLELFREKPSWIGKFKLYKPYIFSAIAIIGLFAYIFVLLFGNKSFIVLMELREYEKELQQSVDFYQQQNAYLQKEIFELSREK